ncbi:hypothetical protein BESB_049680 [Besnoitia besnoiti]|uniref:Transmembrane protein n=1 Tax=Besnoitia besnoiti TaxID=94643 RepID=A0A2A9ML80_BESBE|nr:hypothetical protein BESB_049680 [Besnoitia besnoiti]PFH36776.1 hypothetical protein BESB_049680 [Besnoitia besnoiti]
MVTRLAAAARRPGAGSAPESGSPTSAPAGRCVTLGIARILSSSRAALTFTVLCLFCLTLSGVLADYAGGGGGRRGRGQPHPRHGHQRTTRATPLFSFLGQSLSAESLTTAALLLGAALAALFLTLHRRPSRISEAEPDAAGATGRSKDDDTTFRPCASICLNEILLKRTSDGQKFTVDEAAVAPFLALCSWSKLFVFTQVRNDEDEHQVFDELQRIRAFHHGLHRHRVMFSSTRNGRASMVRQLQPLTHIDADGFIAATLDGKVPNVVHLREPLKDCVDVLQAALQKPLAA